MDPYHDTYTVQRQRNAPFQPAAIVSSFPIFPASYRGAGPWIYSADLNLLPNASATTTIIAAQMDSQPNSSWTNAAAGIGVGHPGLPLPSPQQASFAEYWRHINSQPNSNSQIHYARRHSSSTGSALSSSGSGANGNGTTRNGSAGRNTSLPTSSSYPISLSMASSIVAPHPHTTGRYLVPQLHLNTAGLERGQGHGVPTFLSPPHHMNFSPSADTRPSNRNGDTIWPNCTSNEHNSSPVEPTTRAMVLARSRHATAGGGASISLAGPGSIPAPLWHTVPRLGPPLPSFPRWNHHQLTSSTWIPQMSPADSVSVSGVPTPQPHTQPPYMRQQSASSIMPPPSIQYNPSHFPLHRHHLQNAHSHPPPHLHPPPPPTSSEIPHPTTGAGAGYAYPARVMADTNPTPPSPSPPRGGPTVVSRSTSRPTITVRRRSSLSVSVSASATNLVKRKPLPKIYGCEGCGKKFDRPSTLKVHEAIHTGAKDHLCEYCIRAFTVQSNMKRHMRVCKHKPLSPPMSLCYIISATPSAPFPTRTAPFQTPFQAMQHIDRSSSLMLSGSGGGDGGASSSSTSIHPSIPIASTSTSTRQTPMIETSSGNVPMIAFEHPQYLDHPHSPTHHGPPPTFKGYKAPMIIAAMFSVQQNVPASVAKLTLVHLECDIPLPPVTPHPEYVGLYPDANGFTAKIIEQPEPKEEPFSYPILPQARYSQSSFASSSTSLPSTLHTVETVSSAETEVQPRDEDRSDSPPLEFYVDSSMRTKDTSPLPDIRFEERNSFYPRSRYCYHPAEWDPIGLLPGPGIVDLPEEVAEFTANP